MELKDMILSTLAELDEKEIQKEEVKENVEAKKDDNQIEEEKKEQDEILTDEAIFLKNAKERILVLFEGLQSPKNDNLEIKLDITLNFLEFLLASIEERLEKVK